MPRRDAQGFDLEGLPVLYGLGIKSVRLLPESKAGYGKLLEALKKTLDPNCILAPGRYSLGAEGKEGVFLASTA